MKDPDSIRAELSRCFEPLIECLVGLASTEQATPRAASPPADDADAIELARKIARIKAKPYWSTRETGLVLGKSDNTIRAMVEKAATSHDPIPFLIIDDHLTFEGEKVLAWANRPRPYRKNPQRSSKKKTHSLRAVRN